MIIIYDDAWSCMMSTYDDHVWWSCILILDVMKMLFNIWKFVFVSNLFGEFWDTAKRILKDGYHTWPYMMIMYDNYIWASYMMIIYNDHTCSSYMIMIYVVSSSIKRLIWSWFIHFSIFRMCYCEFVDRSWKQNRQIFRFHDWHFNHASCTSERLLQRQILLQSSSVPFLRHLWKAAAACTIPSWMDMC
jgi:hypothetical protein